MTQSFSDAPMTRRLEALRGLMDTIGVEAVVLTSFHNTDIQENMMVSIEPMISVPGVGGLGHVDMLLVTADGNEVLTKYQRSLISV